LSDKINDHPESLQIVDLAGAIFAGRLILSSRSVGKVIDVIPEDLREYVYEVTPDFKMTYSD
jgi:hypothetical protein